MLPNVKTRENQKHNTSSSKQVKRNKTYSDILRKTKVKDGLKKEKYRALKDSLKTKFNVIKLNKNIVKIPTVAHQMVRFYF